MKRFFTVLSLVVSGFILSSSEICAQSISGYRSESDIAYCSVAGKNLTLNAFLPVSVTSTVPAIVVIHGGWWLWGGAASKVQEVGGWQIFTRHHLAVFSINYRLGAEGGFPESIRDCRNAIRFIRKNATRFNIDPDRIDVMGDSAGGHLSLMVGMVPENFEDGGPTTGLEGVGAQVSGTFSYIQVTDFVRFWNQGPNDVITNTDGKISFRDMDNNIPNDSRPHLRSLFHGIVPDTEAHKALYTEMSPIGHIHKDVPPLLICDGEKDQVVPGLEGKELFEKLKALGADATYWMTPNGGHSFPQGNDFWKDLNNFIVHSLTLTNSINDSNSK